MRLEDTTSQSDEETTSEECTPPPISNDISMPLLTPNEDYTHLQMHHKDRPRRAIQRNEEQTSQNRRHDRSDVFHVTVYVSPIYFCGTDP